MLHVGENVLALTLAKCRTLKAALMRLKTIVLFDLVILPSLKIYFKEAISNKINTSEKNDFSGD